MTILLSLFVALLTATFATMVAVFHRGPLASADWREDWPAWLDNTVCLLPAPQRSVD